MSKTNNRKKSNLWKIKHILPICAVSFHFHQNWISSNGSFLPINCSNERIWQGHRKTLSQLFELFDSCVIGKRFLLLLEFGVRQINSTQMHIDRYKGKEWFLINGLKFLPRKSSLNAENPILLTFCVNHHKEKLCKLTKVLEMYENYRSFWFESIDNLCRKSNLDG